MISDESTTDFVERLASDMNTLPNFLAFDPPINVLSLQNKASYKVVDMLAIVRNSSVVDVPLTKDFPQSIRRYAERIFIATNQVIEKTPANDLETILDRVSRAAISDLSYSEILDAWNNRRSIVDHLVSELAASRFRVVSKLHGFDRIDEIRKSHPEFKRIVVSASMPLSTNYDIKDLFNSVNLSSQIPFAYCDGTYKIVSDVKDARYIDDWIELSSEKLIVLKADSTIAGSGLKYSTIAVAVSDDSSSLEMTVDTFVGKKYLSVDKLIDRIKSSFELKDVKSAAISVKELSVTAYVAYPNQELVASVFADLAMNDNDVSSLVAIDEFYRASKKKQDVHVHFLETEGVTANLSETTTTKYNMFRGTFSGIGERYVRARIKSNSSRELLATSSLMAKIFTRYNDRRNEIVEDYRKFIPEFGTETLESTIKRKKKVSVRDLEPEIFFPNYSRKCLYRPTIIDDSDAESSNLDVMKFPKFGESRQRSYVCENPTHPYPGLQPNVLENKFRFPFVPCCYAKPQRGNPKSAYERYFSSAKKPTYEESIAFQQRKRKLAIAESTTTIVSETVATKKFLAKSVVGKLPDDLNALLVCVARDPAKYFFRIGMSSVDLSCIECVAKSVGKLKLDASEQAISNFVKRTFDEIISDDRFLLAAMQELYDATDAKTVRENVERDKRFFTAKNFVGTLETYFDCDIFIFSSTGLVIPRHVGGVYLKYPPTRSNGTVLLYEHFGSESSSETKSRCELIGYQESDDGVKRYAFENNDDDETFSTKLFEDVFCESTKSFLNGKLSVQPHRPSFYDDVVEQSLNSYGKCRLANVVFEDDGDKILKVTVMFKNLPPFAASKLDRIYGVDENTVSRFVDAYNLVPRYQRVSPDLDKMIELHCDAGTSDVNDKMIIFFTGNYVSDVPVFDDNDDNDAESSRPDRHLLLPYRFRDVAKSFSASKRLARYLRAFSFRSLLSDRPASLEVASKRFVVDTDRDWMSIERIDSNNFEDERLQKLFVRDAYTRTIYVPNEECIKRILFEFTHLIKYGSDADVKSYVSHSRIPESYVDVFDYKIRYGQNVIPNYDTMKRLSRLIKFRPDNIRQTLSSPTEKHPYYLTTDNYEKLHVVQNVDSENEARKACIFFEIKRYNGYSVGDENNDDKTLRDEEYVNFDIEEFSDRNIITYAFEGSNLPLRKVSTTDKTVFSKNSGILVYKYDTAIYFSAIFTL